MARTARILPLEAAVGGFRSDPREGADATATRAASERATLVMAC
jgi:hypothetical protein